MVRFRELYGAMPGVVVPDVLLDYSGTRVLTSEWIDGQKVSLWNADILLVLVKYNDCVRVVPTGEGTREVRRCLWCSLQLLSSPSSRSVRARC